MEFSFIVNASVERVQGKFSTRENIEEELIETIDGANPGSITGENDGEYEVTDWTVEQNVIEKKGKAPKAPKAASADLPVPVNFVNLIREYVALGLYDDPDRNEVEEYRDLFRELSTLCDRFPKITAQERAKITQS